MAAISEVLAQQAGDTFDLVAVETRDQAVADIENRTSYGAIVLAEQGAPEVLTAPAGSAAATSMLTGVASQLQAQLTQQATAAGIDPTTVQVQVTPVVSLSENDPTGAGLTGAAFPMMFGGMIGGAALSMLVRKTSHKFAAALVLSVVSGIFASAILQAWFAFLPGGFWINALAIGASILATSSFIIGCCSLLGVAGIGLGAVTTMLIANPISSAAAPWQFLPEPWGAIGQLFVPGASNWLLRSVNYFPEASDVKQWLVLICWILLGVLLAALAQLFKTKKMRAASDQAPEVEAVAA